ncbi:hypothetical protein CSPX01_02104 [Colletotrichum filicis]|nr:hypothetical protein CSPX01_02104 [Colletotrichum filicis]
MEKTYALKSKLPLFKPETVESYKTMLVSTACGTEYQLRVMRACSLVRLRLSLSIVASLETNDREIAFVITPML